MDNMPTPSPLASPPAPPSSTSQTPARLFTLVEPSSVSAHQSEPPSAAVESRPDPTSLSSTSNCRQASLLTSQTGSSAHSLGRPRSRTPLHSVLRASLTTSSRGLASSAPVSTSGASGSYSRIASRTNSLSEPPLSHIVLSNEIGSCNTNPRSLPHSLHLAEQSLPETPQAEAQRHKGLLSLADLVTRKVMPPAFECATPAFCPSSSLSKCPVPVSLLTNSLSVQSSSITRTSSRKKRLRLTDLPQDVLSRILFFLMPRKVRSLGLLGFPQRASALTRTVGYSFGYGWGGIDVYNQLLRVALPFAMSCRTLRDVVAVNLQYSEIIAFGPHPSTFAKWAFLTERRIFRLCVWDQPRHARCEGIEERGRKLLRRRRSPFPRTVLNWNLPLRSLDLSQYEAPDDDAADMLNDLLIQVSPTLNTLLVPVCKRVLYSLTGVPLSNLRNVVIGSYHPHLREEPTILVALARIFARLVPEEPVSCVRALHLRFRVLASKLPLLNDELCCTRLFPGLRQLVFQLKHFKPPRCLCNNDLPISSYFGPRIERIRWECLQTPAPEPGSTIPGAALLGLRALHEELIKMGPPRSPQALARAAKDNLLCIDLGNQEALSSEDLRAIANCARIERLSASVSLRSMPGVRSVCERHARSLDLLHLAYSCRGQQPCEHFWKELADALVLTSRMGYFGLRMTDFQWIGGSHRADAVTQLQRVLEHLGRRVQAFRVTMNFSSPTSIRCFDEMSMLYRAAAMFNPQLERFHVYIGGGRKRGRRSSEARSFSKYCTCDSDDDDVPDATSDSGFSVLDDISPEEREFRRARRALKRSAPNLYRWYRLSYEY